MSRLAVLSLAAITALVSLVIVVFVATAPHHLQTRLDVAIPFFLYFGSRVIWTLCYVVLWLCNSLMYLLSHRGEWRIVLATSGTMLAIIILCQPLYNAANNLALAVLCGLLIATITLLLASETQHRQGYRILLVGPAVYGGVVVCVTVAMYLSTTAAVTFLSLALNVALWTFIWGPILNRARR